MPSSTVNCRARSRRLRTRLQAMALETLVASQPCRSRHFERNAPRRPPLCERRVRCSNCRGSSLHMQFCQVTSDSHVRQEKTTSPHSGYFYALNSSLFNSTRQCLGYVHPDPPCEFAVSGGGVLEPVSLCDMPIDVRACYQERRFKS